MDNHRFSLLVGHFIRVITLNKSTCCVNQCFVSMYVTVVRNCMFYNI